MGSGLHSNSIAMVIGVSQYQSVNIDNRPSCARSARKFAELLKAEKVCGFEEVVLLTDTVTRKEARSRLKEVCSKDFELILFYFSGHGELEFERLSGELHLAFSDTDSDDLIATSLSKWDIQKIINGSYAQKRIIILDCCYSGAFVEGALSSDRDPLIEEKLKRDSAGSYIMTASREDELAWAPFNEEYPVFSKELIYTLESGIKKIGRTNYESRNILTIDDVYNNIKFRVISAPGNRQEPKSFNSEDAENIQFAYNLASSSLNTKFDQLVSASLNAVTIEDLERAKKQLKKLRKVAVSQNDGSMVQMIDNFILSLGKPPTVASAQPMLKYYKLKSSLIDKIKTPLIVTALFLFILIVILSMPVAPDDNMVKISSGDYTVGYEPDTPYLKYLEKAIEKYSDITPFISEGQVKINIGKGFWIDKFEVTNAQYKTFLNYIAQNGHVRCYREPPNLDHLPLLYRVKRDNYIYEGKKLSQDLKEKIDKLLEDDKPVVSVSYYDAAAYAGWAGKKLPTPEQWEIAARGDGDSTTLYYWGNEFDSSRVNTRERAEERSTFASNDSSVGVNSKGIFGMIGNAAEWLWKEPDSSFTYKIESDWDSNGEIEGALHVHKRYDEEILKKLDIDNIYSGFRCVVLEGEEKSYTDIQDMVYFSPGVKTVGIKLQSKLLKALKARNRLTQGNLELFFKRYKPFQEKHIDTFWIDKFEVTNREYNEFLNWVERNGHSRCYTYEPQRKNHLSDYANDSRLNAPNQPVVGIDWYDAMSFAKWKGKRLPHWYEWEAAVGGKEGRIYPWGNTYDSTRVNDASTKPFSRLTFRVDTLASGASHEGVCQLAGNVAEWMIDSQLFGESEKYYIKGGGYKSFSDIEALRFFNLTGPPTARESWVGFRCVSVKSVSLFSRLFR